MSFDLYFKEVKETTKDENYTEHSLRTPFENLISFISKGLKLTIRHEPKAQKGLGRPDFEIFKDNALIGYIETKKIEDNLDKYIDSEQIQRYLSLSDNLILTNYREFILYRNKEIVKRETLFYTTDKKLNSDNASKVKDLIMDFLSYTVTPITDPQKLANLLALRTKTLREYLTDLIDNNNGQNDFKNRLIGEGGLYEIFKDILIKDLTQNDFIDTYSQTLTYGLFLARLNTNYDTIFNVEKIVDKSFVFNNIPKSLGIIQDLFKTLEISDIPNHISWIVDDLINILNNVDKDILRKELSFSKMMDFEDPYVYFYEHFLATYDKEKRKAKGVYYTPIPVVNFIINSIDTLLKTHFNADFRSKEVIALDFATGTGTFLLETFKKAIEKVDKGQLKSFIKEHILQNFYGFEYLIAPYTVSHLKLSQYLEEMDYKLEDKERLKIYLTDTLDDSEHKQYAIFSRLSKEGKEANEIKLEKPILIVMGNPPYSYESQNKSKWIKDLIEIYKKDLKEKNFKPLNDDYIKFIRYAQWKIEKTGKGIIGIITNNSYLDGLTHRVMRENLLKTFDKIYILNLHGNSRKGENDENVFDIMVGVSIALFVKLEKPLKEKEIYYYSTLENNLIKRENKTRFLLENTIDKIKWIKLNPEKPYYWFIEKDLDLGAEYNVNWSISKIFNEQGLGVLSKRDKLAINFESKPLEKLKDDFTNLDLSTIRKKYKIKDTGDWKLENVIKQITKEESSINKVNYRPFDFRYILYMIHKGLIARPVYNVVKHFLGYENIGLVFCRIWETQKIWSGCFVSDIMIEQHNIGGQSYIAPLYQYHHLEINGDYEKRANFTEDFSKFINKQYTKYKPSPEETLGYIYAILYSNTYRERYKEFLKTDFPKIPFTKNKDLFVKLSEMGTQLINHHLLKVDYPDSTIKYCGEGNNKVESVKYQDNKVYINKTTYFDSVKKEVWEFEIGGYQVLDKYLKSRKDRILTYEEQEHFKKVISSLSETINIMQSIDVLFNELLDNELTKMNDISEDKL